MRTIAIVGAGQAGLQLALGLQKNGYAVTLVSDRSPEEIRDGAITSTQCMFHDALEHERALEVNFWDTECPAVVGIALNIAGPDGNPVLAWQAPLDQPAYSVDQRVKMPRWINHFTQHGGTIVYQAARMDDLERLAATHDLVLVASGKGAISQLFERDAERSPYDAPQRMLAVACVKGYQSNPAGEHVGFNMVPEAGEFIVIPALTTSGAGHYLFFEAIPGGPMDRWDDVQTPAQHLARTHELLSQFLPWEAERAANTQLTDDKAVLRGKFAPTVRKPIGTLPSGKPVLGLADTVVLNDPITGQGSNNAAKAAAVYLERILAHGDAPFDAAWMQATFDTYWDYAQYVTGWTNAMLAPPPPHMLDVLGAAGQFPALARRFVNGFSNPPSFFPWLVDPVAAQQAIAEAAQA